MPELPEVETIRADLEKKILNKKIKEVVINLPKIVKSDIKEFVKTLKNNQITKAARKGKLLILHLLADDILLVHLRMTGQLIFKEGDQLIAGGHSEEKEVAAGPGKHTHIVIEFENKAILFFNDIRQFGMMKLIKTSELASETRNYGIDPILDDFSHESFCNMAKKSTQNIKGFLLDQKKIAGLGNIYVDEVLFLCGIMPTRITNKIKETDLKNLHQNIIKILKTAIKERGTTFNNYSDTDGKKGNFLKFLKVYQRDGQECLVCGSIIQKTKVAGRGTRYCKKCQK